MRQTRSTIVSCTVAIALAATLLAGCSPTPSPSVTSTSAQPSPAATPTSTPEVPALAPDGTAAENLPWFTEIMNDVWDGEDSVKGRAYVDALIEGGFDKADMEVTADKTSVGHAADSIEFSVLWGDECLVGQVGPSIKRPTAVVLPALPSGGCLIGKTRPIDW